MVNNAGIMSFCDVELTPITEWQRLFDINCLGQVRMIQAFLPLLRRTKGRIVNISSAAGKISTKLYYVVNGPYNCLSLIQGQSICYAINGTHS